MKPIVFLSGKGGTGKSVLAASFCAAIASQEKRALLFDADLGLATQDVLCGVETGCTLGHLVRDAREAKDAVHVSRHGFDVVSGGSGWPELTGLNLPGFEKLRESVWACGAEYEALIVDGPAGCGERAIALASCAEQVIVVCTPESTSLLGAYALVKAIHESGAQAEVGFVVNMADSAGQGEAVAKQFQAVVGQFLSVPVTFLGSVRRDNAVPLSVFDRAPFVASRAKCKASQDVVALADKAFGEAGEEGEAGNSLLERLKGKFSGPVEEDQAA